ncbi:ArsR/SmtB family transcription factor [Crossiella cryophila]|uniref:DNA-binding transcriptional ArsR family regulator n=1 Tax=Crossiella cryophila TaxID=43355 RepID=A0A7W7FVQ3_9PSEU|nr:helix-turn-helix transcriptional regulator [Crossiella cryophila]MBB4679295.1 DNA-binding transcriptional ArsR family regulator [Crossiella cryophila]
MSALHPDLGQMSVDKVLAALGHPIRLAAVRILAAQGETYCGAIDVGAAPSTMTTHWRILRESGVVSQRVHGRRHYLRLRYDDLDVLCPGLLEAVLATAAPGPGGSA